MTGTLGIKSLIHSMGVSFAFAFVSALFTPAFAQTRASAPPPSVKETGGQPAGLFDEPAALVKAVTFLERHEGNGAPKDGVYFDFGNMIPGAGWISAGPGYRQWFDRDRAVFETSAAVSWRGYKMARARLESSRFAGGKLTLGSQLRFQDFPQVNMYGTGPESLESDVSEYRLQSSNVVGYATLHPRPWLAINGDAGWLQPSIEPRAGLFKRPRPDTRERFPNDIVYAVGDQPAFGYTSASIVADSRDFPNHPTAGGVLRAGISQFSDRADGLFSFRRVEGEAALFNQLGNSPLVLALRGLIVGTSTSDGSVVPFYLLPAVGGQNTLRSYADYRFHDRNMMVVNAELRVPLMTHLDAAGFVDAGNVAARIADLNLGRRSYGLGLRFHSRRSTWARLDAAHGDEGWRLVLRLTDPFNLSRIARRTAPLPFVP